jgi:hypothetical protein
LCNYRGPRSCGGGAVFAQGFTLNGLVDAGIGVFAGEGFDSFSSPVNATEFSYENNATRVQVDGAWANESESAGINFRIRLDGIAPAQGGGLSLFKYFFGWAKAFDGKLEVKGGAVDDGAFETSDAVWADDLGEGLGLLALVKPVGALTVGFGVYTADNTDTVDLGELKYTAGVAYDLENVLSLKLEYANRGAAGGNENEQVQLGVGVSALESAGLSLALTAIASELQDFSDKGTFKFIESVGFKKDALALGFDLVEGLKLGNDDPLDFRAGLYGAYGLLGGAITPRLDINFLSGYEPVKNGTVQTGYRYDGNFGTYAKETLYLGAKPSVNFTIAEGADFEVGYILDVGLGDADDGLYHAAYANLKVSF